MGNGNNSVDGTNNAATVRFNVGGTHYEVSRSLLAQYPDTMLSRMTSETWLKRKDSGSDLQQDEPIVIDKEDSVSDLQQDEPLFIDRNGDRFQYVLDYMRDGQQVSLPTTVSMEGLLKDMEYFGFQNVSANNIKQQPSIVTYCKLFQDMTAIATLLDKQTKYSSLAAYCFVRVMFSGRYDCLIAHAHQDGEFSRRDLQQYNTDEKKKELKALTQSLMLNKTNDRPCFDRCLEPCGLKLAGVHTDNAYNCYHYVIDLTPR